MSRATPFASRILVGVTSLIGLVAFFYPFFLSEVQAGDNHAADAPLIMLLLGPLLLGIILADLNSHAMNSRVVAALGMLVAINAVLRLPAGPGDSPTFFFLVILAGFVYGGRFGFLLGSLSLAVSALLVAGIGPWMPFQMLAMGWLGLSTALLQPIKRWLKLADAGWGEVVLLAIFGWVWGLLFGGLMNLTFWPFSAGESAISWQPGLGFGPTVERYWAFYLLTSLGWDATRAFFNVLLIMAFGKPILAVLRRFQLRLNWQTQESIEQRT